ncbi:MAG TPA: TIR domain-containing protein [Methanothrix sp.]|nr:TIR domain-containing protein [Methanothrix sp.]HRW83189.1 TIR domain-containing protein [Methanothrix sp.]
MIETADSEVPSSEPKASEIERLEEMAREEIRKGQTLVPRRRAFLIFRVGDSDQVHDFCAAAKKIDPHLDFIDFALKVHFKNENAAYVRHCIRKRIESSSTVVVFVGKTTHDCEWVDWEIRESIRMGKSLAALRLSDDPPLKVPKVLRDRRIKLLSEGDIRELIRKRSMDE